MTSGTISRIARHLNELRCRFDHPGAGWNAWRRAFAHRLLLGLIMAGDTMLTSIVRHFPNQGLAMRHRYKAADRMLGDVDLVPLASRQTELLGHGVDDSYVKADRVRKPLEPGQFWGGTLLDGLRAIPLNSRALVRLIPALWPRTTTTPQLPHPFGGRV